VREFVWEPVDEGDEGRVVGDEALEAPELGAAASDGLGYPRHGPLRLLRREYGAQRRRRPLPRRSHCSPLPHLPTRKPATARTANSVRQQPRVPRHLLAGELWRSPLRTALPPCLICWPSACASRFTHHSRGEGRGPATRKAMNLTGPTGGRLPVDGGWGLGGGGERGAVAEWELRLTREPLSHTTPDNPGMHHRPNPIKRIFAAQ